MRGQIRLLSTQTVSLGGWTRGAIQSTVEQLYYKAILQTIRKSVGVFRTEEWKEKELICGLIILSCSHFQKETRAIQTFIYMYLT